MTDLALTATLIEDADHDADADAKNARENADPGDADPDDDDDGPAEPIERSTSCTVVCGRCEEGDDLLSCPGCGHYSCMACGRCTDTLYRCDHDGVTWDDLDDAEACCRWECGECERRYPTTVAARECCA